MNRPINGLAAAVAACSSSPRVGGGGGGRGFAWIGVGGKRKGNSSLPLAPLSQSLRQIPSTSTSPTTKLAALRRSDPAPPPQPSQNRAPPIDASSLTGRWHKVKGESDDMTAACDAVELSRVLRIGIGLVNDLVISDERGSGSGGSGSGSGVGSGGSGSGGSGSGVGSGGVGSGDGAYFATTLKAGGILDVKERYPWSGESVEHRRRDKRRGRHVGRVSLVEFDDGTEKGEGGGGGEGEEGEKTEGKKSLHPCISVTWGDPLGGECTDTFVLAPGGRKMTQYTVLAVRGKKTVRYKTVYGR